MNKHVWMMALPLVGVVALPSEAQARPPYLEALSDATETAFGATACALPGMTCGLCHEPSEGDRLENVVVGGADIETGTRNGPLFDSLTGPGGWMPMGGGGDAVGPNAMMLEDEVVPAMVGMSVDSDGDGVGDIEELALGYNPLLAYDDADAALSQLCGDAEPFPDPGGSSSSGGSEGSSTGEPDPTTGGPIDPSTTSDSTTTSTTMPPPDDESSTSGASGSGSSGGTGSNDGGDDGGCRIGGSGRDVGVFGLLLALGLLSGRRRRAG